MIERHYREESRRVFASLVRLLGDFDLAEEALSDSYAEAFSSWPESGIPDNPTSWLISTGRFKTIDQLRRRERLNRDNAKIVERIERIAEQNAERSVQWIEDDRLRLIFTCCHPAIAFPVQVALTLREVCGLSTEDIAANFLTSVTTMAQRIVRGKAKIRDAGIPFKVPDPERIAERLEAVLAVIYLVFTTGYAAPSGGEFIRADLCQEAIRLARLLNDLYPDPEIQGLLALMLIQHSRRDARLSPDGEVLLLHEQDRSKWDLNSIAEGTSILSRILSQGVVGEYSIQAAIASLHVEAESTDRTDWKQIVFWYDLLMQTTPTPVVELNRAVAIGMRDGFDVGLDLVLALSDRVEMKGYHLYHATVGDFHRRLENRIAAAKAFEKAIEYAPSEAERSFLLRRLNEVNS